MALNKFIIVCLGIFYSTALFATDMGCKSYYQNPKNLLNNIIIFNANSVIDKDPLEIPVTSEAQQRGRRLKIWDLNFYQGKKIFIRCFYTDNTSLTKEIPPKIKVCVWKGADKNNLRASILRCSKK